MSKKVPATRIYSTKAFNHLAFPWNLHLTPGSSTNDPNLTECNRLMMEDLDNSPQLKNRITKFSEPLKSLTEATTKIDFTTLGKVEGKLKRFPFNKVGSDIQIANNINSTQFLLTIQNIRVFPNVMESLGLTTNIITENVLNGTVDQLSEIILGKLNDIEFIRERYIIIHFLMQSSTPIRERTVPLCPKLHRNNGKLLWYDGHIVTASGASSDEMNYDQLSHSEQHQDQKDNDDDDADVDNDYDNDDDYDDNDDEEENSDNEDNDENFDENFPYTHSGSLHVENLPINVLRDAVNEIDLTLSTKAGPTQDRERTHIITKFIISRDASNTDFHDLIVSKVAKWILQHGSIKPYHHNNVHTAPIMATGNFMLENDRTYVNRSGIQTNQNVKFDVHLMVQFTSDFHLGVREFTNNNMSIDQGVEHAINSTSCFLLSFNFLQTPLDQTSSLYHMDSALVHCQLSQSDIEKKDMKSLKQLKTARSVLTYLTSLIERVFKHDGDDDEKVVSLTNKICLQQCWAIDHIKTLETKSISVSLPEVARLTIDDLPLLANLHQETPVAYYLRRMHDSGPARYTFLAATNITPTDNLCAKDELEQIISYQVVCVHENEGGIEMFLVMPSLLKSEILDYQYIIKLQKASIKLFKGAIDVNPYRASQAVANFAEAKARSTLEENMFSHITISGLSLSMAREPNILFNVVEQVMNHMCILGPHAHFSNQSIRPLFIQDVNLRLDISNAVTPRYKNMEDPTIMFKLLHPISSMVCTCTPGIRLKQNDRNMISIGCTLVTQEVADALKNTAREIGVVRPVPFQIMHTVYNATLTHYNKRSNEPVLGIVMVVNQIIHRKSKNSKQLPVTHTEYVIGLFSQAALSPTEVEELRDTLRLSPTGKQSTEWIEDCFLLQCAHSTKSLSYTGFPLKLIQTEYRLVEINGLSPDTKISVLLDHLQSNVLFEHEHIRMGFIYGSETNPSYVIMYRPTHELHTGIMTAFREIQNDLKFGTSNDFNVQKLSSLPGADAHKFYKINPVDIKSYPHPAVSSPTGFSRNTTKKSTYKQPSIDESTYNESESFTSYKGNTMNSRNTNTFKSIVGDSSSSSSTGSTTSKSQKSTKLMRSNTSTPSIQEHFKRSTSSSSSNK